MMEPTIDELIASGDWDGVAQRYEGFEVERSVQRPISDWWLRCAAGNPGISEAVIRAKVASARADGVSWRRIGDLLSISAQEAAQRYVDDGTCN